VLQPKTVVTLYDHGTAYCPCCGRPVFQTAPGELRNCQIGPVTKATAIYLRHEVKLSYRDVQKIFSGLFNMPFVPASAMAFDRETSRKGEVLYEDLRDKIRAADILHGDETHWRIDGNSAFVWYAGNTDLAFFHVDRSRSAEVALSIYGPRFQGSLVSDDYAVYQAIAPKRRQSCLAHIITKAKDITKEIELLEPRHQDTKAMSFCDGVRTLFKEVCKLGQQREAGKVSFAQAKNMIPAFCRAVKKLGRQALEFKKAENLRKRIVDPKKSYKHLFTFLKVPHLPPTNNQAEQTLRLPVIFRKICFGNRSEGGAKSFSINLSLSTTAKRQGKHPITLFKTILLGTPEEAKRELYAEPPEFNDSS